jgi:hypothetical protein
MALGAFDAVDPVLEGYLMSALAEAGVAADVVPLGEGEDWSRAEQVFAESHVPVLRFEHGRHDRLANLAATMKPRKIDIGGSTSQPTTIENSSQEREVQSA